MKKLLERYFSFSSDKEILALKAVLQLFDEINNQENCYCCYIEERNFFLLPYENADEDYGYMFTMSAKLADDNLYCLFDVCINLRTSKIFIIEKEGFIYKDNEWIENLNSLKSLETNINFYDFNCLVQNYLHQNHIRLLISEDTLKIGPIISLIQEKEEYISKQFIEEHDGINKSLHKILEFIKEDKYFSTKIEAYNYLIYMLVINECHKYYATSDYLDFYTFIICMDNNYIMFEFEFDIDGNDYGTYIANDIKVLHWK